MNELALFAGAGGGILGGHLLGWRTRCAVELDAYARAVLLQRQADGCLPRFPIWDDVRTFDGKPWRGRVQVVSGGFPCTDISRANANAEGLDGDKSGLWFEMARIIGEVRPDYAFVENSPFLVGRGLVRVLADLAELGFDARWCVLGAYHAGAPHARERIWIVAHAMRARKPDWWAGGFGRWIGSEHWRALQTKAARKRLRVMAGTRRAGTAPSRQGTTVTECTDSPTVTPRSFRLHRPLTSQR